MSTEWCTPEKGSVITEDAPRRKFLAGLAATGGLLGCAAAAAWPSIASAQPAFPSRPVRIIVGFPPGGGTDAIARLIAPKMSQAFRQPVLVENKPGANGVLATQFVATSPADGHTILMGTTGNLSVNPVFLPNLPFEMERDFAPVTQVVSVSFLVMANPSIDGDDLAALIRQAKARPGSLSYSSSGAGGLPHLATEALNRQAGLRAVHVPYKGSAPAMTDVIGGQVQFFIDAVAIGLPQIKAGRLKALATTSARRLPMLPDIPSVSETLPGFDVVNWYGMVVPKATPSASIASLQRAVADALADPEIVERLGELGVEPVGSPPEAFGRFMRAESQRWGSLIREVGIKPE